MRNGMFPIGLIILALYPLCLLSQEKKPKNATPPPPVIKADTTKPPPPPPLSFKNAYEIAQDLYQASQSKDSAGIVESLAALTWYTGAQKFEDVIPKLNVPAEYTTLYNLALNLYNGTLDFEPIFYWNPANLSDYFKGDSTAGVRLKEALEKVIQHRDGEIERRTAAVTSQKLAGDFKEKADSVRRLYENTKELLNRLDSLKKINPNDMSAISGNQDTTALLNQLARLTTQHHAYDKEFIRYDSLATSHALQIEPARSAVRELLKQPAYSDLRKKWFAPDLNKGGFRLLGSADINNKVQTIGTQVAIYEQQIIREQAGGLIPLSFKMPSQTEMIDALAIYLAKRVKQETVLWFFETLRKSATVNGLIREGFPETIKLLEGSAIYETPNMGSAWRYALSKDFITFPEHVFQSAWLRNYIPENSHVILQDLKLGVNIATLLQQKYSYHDIVRYLYMQTSGLPESDASLTRHVISLLYGLQQELLLAVGKKDSSYAKKIDFEDLLQMPDEAFLMMLELIDIRYNKCIAGVLGRKIELSPLRLQQLQQLKSWVGKLQFTVQQIDNARNELSSAIKQLNNQPDGGKFSFTHYSVWKFLQELMQNALPDTSVTAPGAMAYRTSLHYLGKAQEIYELLENKNYSGAIGVTFNILDEIVKPRNQQAAAVLHDARLLFDVVQRKGDRFKLPSSMKKDFKELVSGYAKAFASEMTKKGLDSMMARIRRGENYQEGADKVTIRADSIIVSSLTALNILQEKKFANRKAFTDYLADTLTKHFIASPDVAKKLRDFSESRLLYRDQDYSATRQSVMRLASFLNDVSLAEDSKKLAQVIESYAMPPGSYKRKRSVWYSIDLNAFVGAYAGKEFITKTFSQEGDRRFNGGVYGISAPIGVSWSRSLGRNIQHSADIKDPGNVKYLRSGMYRPNGSTLTLTASIVDLGAVVSYRFENTNSVLPQEFKWDQFISPGLHIGYGLKGTPLVVNAGFVFTPQLRRIADSVIVNETKVLPDRQFNTYRMYIGLFFDIPLFNLWERKSINRIRSYKPRKLGLQNKGWLEL